MTPKRRQVGKLVVFGCSYTKDHYIDTWANLLAKELGVELCNLAERGAGYDYIVQKVITSPLSSEDLVVVMWPTADRFDLYINAATPHLQNDIANAGWLNGQCPTFVDYDGNYNQETGWYLTGAVPRGYKHYYYKFFYNQALHVNKAWSSIVLIQNYLDNIHVPYVMCNSYPVQNLIQYNIDHVTDFDHRIYKAIDFGKFVKDAAHRGFVNLVKEQNFDFYNAYYPKSQAHEWYVKNYLLPKLDDLL